MFGIVVSALIGLLFLLPFPSWSSWSAVVTSASVLMYAGAPLALAALRKQKPDLPRPYRLPAARGPGAVVVRVRHLVILFSGWETYTTLMVAMLHRLRADLALLRLFA